MKDYTKFMKWAVITMIDRKTQDDRRSKVIVSALFEAPIVAEDFYIPNLPNKEHKRYIIHVDDLARFEEFYNHVKTSTKNSEIMQSIILTMVLQLMN